MSLVVIPYKDIEVFYMDFSDGESEEDHHRLLIESAERIRKEKDKSAYLIYDPADMPVTNSIFERIKSLGKEVFDKKCKAQTIVNLNFVKRIFLYTYNKLSSNPVTLCSSREEALEFLWEQSKKGRP